MIKTPLAIYLLFACVLQVCGQHIWTFDCDEQQWGSTNHSRQFDQDHILSGPNQDQGRLILYHTYTSVSDWLFAPPKLNVNADQLKYVLFSMEGRYLGDLPQNGVARHQKLSV